LKLTESFLPVTFDSTEQWPPDIVRVCTSERGKFARRDALFGDETDAGEESSAENGRERFREIW
jgi:hypothetical protein